MFPARIVCIGLPKDEDQWNTGVLRQTSRLGAARILVAHPQFTDNTTDESAIAKDVKVRARRSVLGRQEDQRLDAATWPDK